MPFTGENWHRLAKLSSNYFLTANNKLRRNFSFVTRYSLKFTRCLLLVVKSLVTRCKICSLLLAEFARRKKWLFTRCRNCSLQNVTRYLLQNSLVTRCRSSSLQKIARYSLQKITRYSLQNSRVTCRKTSLLSCYEKNPWTNVYLKPIK